jgi:thiamine biosynthesis protein ThiI
MTTYLLKLGELTLKGGNREEFELKLRQNIRALLKGTGARVDMTKGRFFVRCPDGAEKATEEALDLVIGITGWAKARACAKTVEAVIAACVAEARALSDGGARSFKIEARRSDKSFPIDSYGIMREAGSAVLDAVPSLTVDVHNPDHVIDVEIRENAYVYGVEHPGRRGLPVGSSGRGMLLLSGGIDSPVAGYLMARRGMRIEAIYFHAYPYTSREAQEKVARLASIFGRYAMGVRLTTVPFTKAQLRIKEKAPEAWNTVLLRMAMMEAADRLARASRCKCLITGESVGQVASQTIENIACAESRATLPVLRPLVGTDKQDTVNIAKKIGTYETSILPYEDCCVIFSPKHPILKGDVGEATTLYESLELAPFIEEALRERSVERCGFPRSGSSV